MSSIQECLSGVDAIVITTPDPMFANLELVDFEMCNPNAIIYDYWRILAGKFTGSSFRYTAAGIPVESNKNSELLKKMWNE
jgi:hypothetical protein